MLRVTVFPDITGEYTSQVYAGLYDLRAKGEIEIKYKRTGFPRQNPLDIRRQFVLLKVSSDRRTEPINICIDLIDGKSVESTEYLNWSDVYFKRSYREGNYQHPGQKKIVPYGFHYACTSLNEQFWDRAITSLLSNLNLANLRARPILAIKRTLSQPVRFALLKHRNSLLFTGIPMTEDIFDVPPSTNTTARIYYRTRVYTPTMASKQYASGAIRRINDMRANTIRALKTHFGDQFIGGLRPTEFSLEHYGDCTMQEEIGFQGHLKIMQSSLICVTTSGLFDSVDWKVPEYMAASRCIVSERLSYKAPIDLVDGLHISTFSTPGECVKNCQHLLDNPDLSQKMREAAYDYFQRYVRAESIMRNTLELAEISAVDR